MFLEGNSLLHTLQTVSGSSWEETMAAAFFLVFDFPLDFALLDFENHSLCVAGCVYVLWEKIM